MSSLSTILGLINEIDTRPNKTDADYAQRTSLVYQALAQAAICGYVCGIRYDEASGTDWPVISIDLPRAGQVAWHCQATTAKWDGHTDEVKAARITKFISSAVKKVLVEDSWEAEDIVQYCMRDNIECRVLSPKELTELDSNEFMQYVPFCSTDIVRQHLVCAGQTERIPDTYETVYRPYLHREIRKVPFSEVVPGSFVKPIANDKSFDGQVYYDDERFLGPLPSAQTEVYTCEAMRVLSEYRLLIGNHRLYGRGYMSGARIDDLLPKSMIEELVNLTDNYRCVDIGYVKFLTGAGAGTSRWVVIEINPAFSLDDYDIPLADYMQFCLDAWHA